MTPRAPIHTRRLASSLTTLASLAMRSADLATFPDVCGGEGGDPVGTAPSENRLLRRLYALSRGQTTGRGSAAHARHARRPGEPFDPEPRGSRARSTCQPTGLTSSERGEAAVMSRAERRLCLSSPSPPDCSAAPAGARDRDRSRQHGNRHNPSTRGTPRGMLGRPEASSNVERRSTMTRRAGLEDEAGHNNRRDHRR